MPDDEPSKNPFVRFKQQVDAHVSATLHGLLGIPAIVSQNLNLNNNMRASNDEKPKTRRERLAEIEEIINEMDSKLGEMQGLPPKRPSTRFTLSTPIDPLQMFAWQYFLSGSPYSPLNLLHLPQPVPSDVPSDLAAQDFTFMDAFEDLLEVSATGVLPDLSNHQPSWPYNTAPYQHFRRSKEDIFMTKMRYARSYIDAYFPLPPAGHDSDLASGEEQYAWRKEALAQVRELATQRATFSRQDWLDRPDTPIGLFDQLNKVFKVLDRVLEEERRLQEPKEVSQKPKKEGEVDLKMQVGAWDEEPDTEAQLFQAVKSTYEDADKSFVTFVKSISDAKFSSKASTSFSKSVNRFDSAANDRNVKTFKDTEEHTDSFGNLHVKTTIRKVNADGEEVARETHYTVHSTSQSKRGVEEEGAQSPPEKKDETEKNKPGWFWK